MQSQPAPRRSLRQSLSPVQGVRCATVVMLRSTSLHRPPISTQQVWSRWMMPRSDFRKFPFLSGVFLITFSDLIFQILQTRILSVIAWYYLAFFAISVAMLGMTAGAVWVYLQRDRFESDALPVILSDFAMLTAVAMPASVVVQYCLITTLAASWN